MSLQQHGYDAVVVGSGPNGLAAAITFAREGRRVLVREASAFVGGGMRSAELTLPGFTHDVCSAVHPLAVASPFFRSLPLAEHGLRWVEPPVALAHPFDDREPALLQRSLADTAATLGEDGARYRDLIEPFVERWDALVPDVLAPLRLPHHPLLMARFGLTAVRSASSLLRAHFRGESARALLAGISAHAAVPLTRPASMSFGLVLGAAAHAVGWPVPMGGTGRLADALASHLRSLGGEIETGSAVHSLDELPPSRAVLLDVTPRQLIGIAGDRLPARYRRRLERFRYGPGSFKVDWALAAPVPWRDADCRRAGTVHLGATMTEIATSEAAPWRGVVAERPYVVLAQPSLFDDTRAPAGRHVLWGYCHLPNGSGMDMLDRIEGQIERFAPGFRDVVLARHVMPPARLESYNANYVGGDIGAGANTLDQLFFRPVARRTPYATPVDGLFICSASTPPGGGVHGMNGWHAARAALRG